MWVHIFQSWECGTRNLGLGVERSSGVSSIGHLDWKTSLREQSKYGACLVSVSFLGWLKGKPEAHRLIIFWGSAGEVYSMHKGLTHF